MLTVRDNATAIRIHQSLKHYYERDYGLERTSRRPYLGIIDIYRSLLNNPKLSIEALWRQQSVFLRPSDRNEMLRAVLLLCLICSTTSSLPQIQEQFSKLSRDGERQLKNYRAVNSLHRRQITHRILNALGNLTVEVRGLTAHYWAQIEAHHLATGECLELIRPHFKHYAAYAQQDIQAMAQDLERYVAEDAVHRFYPVAAEAQQENSGVIHRPLQTMAKKLTDTVCELNKELGFVQEWWKKLHGRLKQEIDGSADLGRRVDDSMERWYEFIMKWHHYFMGMQLERVDYECDTENSTLSNTMYPLLVE